MEGCSFLDFLYFFKDRPPNRKKSPKTSPQERQVGHFAPQLGHLNPILAPTWPILAPLGPILAPFWPSRGRPKLAQIASKTNLEPTWSKTAPKTAQTPPKTPLDIDFFRFLIVFLCFSGCLSVKALPKKPNRSGGRRYSPAGRLRYHISL